VKKRIFLVSCLLGVLVASGVFPWLSRAEDELATARNTYESALSQIETESSSKLKSWPAQYVKALKALQQKMQSSGDLDGWTAVNNEIERFKTDKRIRKSSIVSEPAELASLQSSYRDAVEKMTSEKNQGICRLTKVYLSRLNGMKRNLTVAGKIDDALAVNAEIERVKSSPTVMEAEFAVAEYEAGKGMDETEEETAEKEASDTSELPEVDLPRSLSSLSKTGDAEVHRTKIAPDAGVKFKREELRPTELGRHKRRANVRAYLASRKLARRSTGRYYRRRSSNTEHLVRLTLRTGKSTDVFDDVTVVVQYFSKSAVKGSGKIIPRQLAVHCVSVGKLDNNVVHIDFPGVSVHRYRYRYSRRYVYSSGEKFYGIVVTVFQGENKLLYQGMAGSSLEDIGLDVMFEGRGAIGDEED
jgi:hypothetical protein